MAVSRSSSDSTAVDSRDGRDEPAHQSPLPSQDLEKQSQNPADVTESRANIDNETERQTQTQSQPVDEESPFTVCWDEDDPDSPYNWTNARKWIIALLVSSSTLCITCTSSLVTTTYDQITVEFECSHVVATLSISLFIFGLGTGPLILAPLSEFYGRRPIYIVSLLLFIVGLIPCALARNIVTMLIFRFLDGLAGAASSSVAGGTIGDIFMKDSLQAPMLVYTASTFIGAGLGPVVGGPINQYLNWRWSFYVLIIWAFFQWLLVTLFVPETYHPVLLRTKAGKLRWKTNDQRWQAPIERSARSISKTILHSISRPLLLLTLEPMVLNLCLFSALLLGIQYLFFAAFPLIFRTTHSLTLLQTGLAFLGILAGMLFAVATHPLWSHNYHRLVQNHLPCLPEPEFRLPPALAGAP